MTERPTGHSAAGDDQAMPGDPNTTQGIDQIIEQIRVLAKIPSENPNPVLRLTLKGGLLYANEAALAIDRLLVGPKKRTFNRRLARRVIEVARSGKPMDVELESGGRIYNLALTPVSGESCINVYGRDVTEERLASRRIEDLARFPAENPNPVLRVTRDGAVLYANEAAHGVAGLLTGREKVTLSARVAKEVARAAKTGKRRELEFESGDRTFALVAAPVKGANYRVHAAVALDGSPPPAEGLALIIAVTDPLLFR